MGGAEIFYARAFTDRRPSFAHKCKAMYLFWGELLVCFLLRELDPLINGVVVFLSVLETCL